MKFEIDKCMINNCFNESHNYSTVSDVPSLDSDKLNYLNFFQNYMLPNVPCIIKKIANNWESSKNWLKEGLINFEYLHDKYEHLKVRIYDCSKRYYNSQESYETTFSEYLNYFESSTIHPDRLEYLKNWHLQQCTKDCFYEVPLFFASDWLNEYYINCVKSDDYRFVYMGPVNTWTPFHADVFTSFSWSVNVCGRKKWILFPPGEEVPMKDSSGYLPYDINEIDVLPTNSFEIIQEPSEAIFVPSGWHHQVWNLEDTISINHNWINGCNIKSMYDSLISNLGDIEKELSDIKDTDDFYEHCQIMLNSIFGMDFINFYDFLKYISLARIRMLEGKTSKLLFHGHEIGDNHLLFDLRAVKNVLNLFVNREELNILDYFNDIDIQPTDLLNLLEDNLK